jgi:hypothetical protein
MWFVNERIIRECAYRGAMITSAANASIAFGLAQGLVEVLLRLLR